MGLSLSPKYNQPPSVPDPHPNKSSVPVEEHVNDPDDDCNDA